MHFCWKQFRKKHQNFKVFVDIIMTNQQFCYWLQGYLEISQRPDLTKEKIIIIENEISKIKGPLGQFPQWFLGLSTFFLKHNYKKDILNYFLPVVERRLNMIFAHVIDNNYDENIGKDEARRIHNGL